ncbi:MAG: T9SS type A sorting domain-containing protein [Bacteroidia bacterium]|nr:T9SS type A sorting domain-containing protein [Bacteroidia bacterium]
MKIVKLFAFIFCLIAFERTKAQAFLVGDTSCNFVPLHYQINPFSNIPQTSGGFTYTTTYTVDVDGDLTSDFKFNWDVNGYNGGSGTNHTCNLKLTSPSNYEFVCLTTPSNCNSLQVENLANFSAISSNLNWSLITVNKLIYSYCLGFANGCQGVGCGYYFPYGPTNLRIGFRKILTNDTIYGWLYLKTASQHDEVVSYGFRHTINANTVTPVFTSATTSICLGASLSFTASPSGGSFFGNGVSGNTFNSSLTGAGVHTVYYSKNCSTSSLNVTVSSNPIPTLAITNSLTSVCYGDSIVLNGLPASGTFFGPGITGNIFHSSVTGIGPKTISYSDTNSIGCSNTITLNINVVTGPSITITSSFTNSSCPGQPVTLAANGVSNYTWSTGSTSQSITVTPTVNTTYSVIGAFATGSCQSSTASFTQNVSLSACVGIKEIKKENEYLQIFPNPNSGEFEIKGIKEETIYISNELGQTITTVNLNAENNFSYKIIDLSSGLYFVGNKFAKQKIVVIK